MLREIIESVKKCKVLHYNKIKKQQAKDLIDQYDFEVNYIDDGKKFKKVSDENKEIIRKIKMIFPNYGLLEKDGEYIILNIDCATEIPSKPKEKEPEERPFYTLTYPSSLASFIKKYILKTDDNIKISKDITKIFVNNKEKYHFELPKCANIGMDNVVKTTNPFNKDEDILFSSKDEKCYKEIIKNIEEAIK